MSIPISFNTGSDGYCVARPGGKYCVIFPSLNKIETQSEIISLSKVGRLLWLDLAVNGKIAGTSWSTPNVAYEWNGTVWSSAIKCYSVPRCCIYVQNNLLVTVQTPGETGSLGYIQVADNGLLVKTIDHYANPPIYEYITRGSVTVGHGGKSNLGENPLICKIDGVFRLLETGNCLAVKFYREGDSCAIAWINGSLSKIWYPTVAELKTFPIYNPVTTPIPIPPEVPVGLPTKVNDLWKQWNAKFPIPLGEDNIRQWMIKFCEQANFTFPNEGLGTKSADPNRPISKDTISQVTPASAANNSNPNSVKIGMKSWDMVTGAGSTNPKPLYSGQTEYNTTNQWFRKVSSVNHLGTGPIPIPPISNKDREFILHLQEEIDSYLENN